MSKANGHRFTCDCWECRGEEPKGSASSHDKVRQYYQNLKLSSNWSSTVAIENVLEMLNITIKGVNDHE